MSVCDFDCDNEDGTRRRTTNEEYSVRLDRSLKLESADFYHEKTDKSNQFFSAIHYPKDNKIVVTFFKDKLRRFYEETLIDFIESKVADAEKRKEKHSKE
jgi:hypothetical protein